MIALLHASPDSPIARRLGSTSAPRSAHWFVWRSLIWSIWLFVTPLYEPRYFGQWFWPTMASYAVFLALYACAYYRHRRDLRWCVAGMAALAFALLPYNPGAQCYISPPYLISAALVGLAVGLMNISFERRALQAHTPDLLVADIEMPGLSGLELAQRLQRQQLPIRVVIVTTFARPGFLRRALDAGVGGHLLKDAPPGRLVDAIRQVHRGSRAIDPELALEAWSEADPLNDRERQVLRLAGEGA
ncbi:Conserved hypothetical membrane protein [Xanthomonas translucens pv. translucens DSM 18974]|uniref:Conserved hypothetical membrane protein n=1 Tax=Xanthomonas translucens pv. translucens DSM 18974 TaxID=1261556 RepID=A0A1C3TTJ9_XANCT|nr:putative transcriptional regulator ycf27 [Xanthomonas translucens pv. translucens DSM 18974]SCB06594.1 Conserved hypothetical membrane protein [Xanthomonas translucens pv. translucens DSM 18974]